MKFTSASIIGRRSSRSDIEGGVLILITCKFGPLYYSLHCIDIIYETKLAKRIKGDFVRW